MIGEHTTKQDSKNNVRIGLVGAGRLGNAVIRTFGKQIRVIVTSRMEEVQRTLPGTDTTLYSSIADVPPDAFDVLWLAVPDRAIADVVEDVLTITTRQYQQTGGTFGWNNKIALHSSGATPLAVLKGLREHGAQIAVLHPNAILSGQEPLPLNLVWGVSFEGLSMEWAADFLAPAQPKLIPVSDQLRPLYHSAAALAANYSMTLFHSACRLYEATGVESSLAAEIVARFMGEGVRAATEQGVVEGLTGPVARGDILTVQQHLRSINQATPELTNVIAELVRTTVMLARPSEIKEWDRMISGMRAEG